MVAQQDIENPGWMSSFQFAELVLCLLWPRYYHHFCTLQHFKWCYWSKSQSQCCISACHQRALELSDTLFVRRESSIISESSKGTNLVMTRAHFFPWGTISTLGWYQFPSFPLKAGDSKKSELRRWSHKVANIAANGLASVWGLFQLNLHVLWQVVIMSEVWSEW